MDFFVTFAVDNRTLTLMSGLKAQSCIKFTIGADITL